MTARAKMAALVTDWERKNITLFHNVWAEEKRKGRVEKIQVMVGYCLLK